MQLDYEKETCPTEMSVRFCCHSDIQCIKCQKISKGLEELGVRPLMTCIRSVSVTHCLHLISISTADFAIVQHDYFFTAVT